MDHHHHMEHHQMDMANHSAHMMGTEDQMDQSMLHGDHSSHGVGMDHDHMDMGGGGHMMHMSMTFHFGCIEKILFDSWSISSTDGLIGSMVGIFFLALVYEGLKYFREYLFWKTYNSLQYSSVQMPIDKSLSDCNRVVQPSIFSINHAIQTLLHIVQITLSYFLMLIFMTYNVWLCIAVVLGAAVGYFLFGWKKSVVVDVTEHCH